MNRTRAQRVLAMFESRGDVERISGADVSAARACLARARTRFEAAVLLAGADHWDVAFTTAYDACCDSAGLEAAEAPATSPQLGGSCPSNG
jgi:hypothetical protein